MSTLALSPSRSDRRGLTSIPEADNLINHFVLVGDMSPSMHPHSRAFVQAFDNLVASLATRSKELDQETRVTVYLFSSTSVCTFFDMDVLRLPSIKKLYNPAAGYRTALMDATSRAIADLKQTSQKYGEHAFVLYALTDGEENDSHLVTRPTFRNTVHDLPDNWTVATLVPDAAGVRLAHQLGFPAGNIDIWDTTSATGSAGALGRMDSSIANFMGERAKARASGTKFTSTTNLFSMDSDVLNEGNLFKAGVTPVDPGNYILYTVAGFNDGMAIKPFVEMYGHKYHLGIAYYELMPGQRVTVQPGKKIAILGKDNGKVYAGDHARELLGLGDDSVRISGGSNPKFSVFIQSTSVNRKLLAYQRVLVMP